LMRTKNKMRTTITKMAMLMARSGLMHPPRH
jgi:hypothetical protein